MSLRDVLSSGMNFRKLSDADIEALIAGDPVAGTPGPVTELVGALRSEYDATPTVGVGTALGDFINVVERTTIPTATRARRKARLGTKAAAVFGALSANMLLGVAVAAASVGGAQVLGVVDVVDVVDGVVAVVDVVADVVGLPTIVDTTPVESPEPVNDTPVQAPAPIETNEIPPIGPDEQDLLPASEDPVPEPTDPDELTPIVSDNGNGPDKDNGNQPEDDRTNNGNGPDKDNGKDKDKDNQPEDD